MLGIQFECNNLVFYHQFGFDLKKVISTSIRVLGSRKVMKTDPSKAMRYPTGCRSVSVRSPRHDRQARKYTERESPVCLPSTRIPTTIQ